MSKKNQMSGRNHAADRKHAGKKRSASAGKEYKNDFKKNPFINLKEEVSETSRADKKTNRMSRKEAKQVAELIGYVMEELFGGEMEGQEGPVIGVLELDPEKGFLMDLQGSEMEEGTDAGREGLCEGPLIPPCDGCGEEVFQEMLADLHYLATMILEADFLMKLAGDGNVNPEDARCVTYLSVHEAREIMNKWDAYRRTDF